MKNGPDDGDVRQVTATKIGVVQDEQVSVVDFLSEVIPNGGAGHGERADVHRDALALGHQLTIAVEDCG